MEKVTLSDRSQRGVRLGSVPAGVAVDGRFLRCAIGAGDRTTVSAMNGRRRIEPGIRAHEVRSHEAGIHGRRALEPRLLRLASHRAGNPRWS